ncbi:hypothetical protein JCM17961_11730 [Endothiovibrio diazotrophicus]
MRAQMAVDELHLACQREIAVQRLERIAVGEHVDRGVHERVVQSASGGEASISTKSGEADTSGVVRRGLKRV